MARKPKDPTGDFAKEVEPKKGSYAARRRDIERKMREEDERIAARARERAIIESNRRARPAPDYRSITKKMSEFADRINTLGRKIGHTSIHVAFDNPETGDLKKNIANYNELVGQLNECKKKLITEAKAMGGKISKGESPNFDDDLTLNRDPTKMLPVLSDNENEATLAKKVDELSDQIYIVSTAVEEIGYEPPSTSHGM